MTAAPAGRDVAKPHAADLALIPFATGSHCGAAHFVLTADLTRHDGALYDATDDQRLEEWRRAVVRAATEGDTSD
jgi:hypothetical protein